MQSSGCMQQKENDHLLLLGFRPRLALFLCVVDPQLFQHYVAPIIARAIPSTHLPTFLHESSQRPRGRSCGVHFVLDWVTAAF